MQRGEDEREKRLGDAGVGGEVGREGGETLARGERLDEPGERRCRLVHAAGGNSVPRGDRSDGALGDAPSGAPDVPSQDHNDPQGHSRVPSWTLTEIPCQVGHGIANKESESASASTPPGDVS